MSPNLFDFAPGELSQDAFICWLASWADPALKGRDEALHATATAFLDRLLQAGKGPKVLEYRSVKVRRQPDDIDVLVEVNGDTAILIEDKTDTQDHSDQLKRYKEIVARKFPADRIAAVYLKTGDQGNYRSVDQAGYGKFLRRDFLDVLDRGELAGVKNDIFADFLSHLRGIDAAVRSFDTAPLEAWEADWRRWKGFFLVLQERLGEGDWSYVANPSGGFMGFWWHGRDDKYLQLENEKLCFKLTVPGKADRSAKWREWHDALMTESGLRGMKLKKPVRREGQWMTVAVLDEYRRPNAEGRVDLDRTVETLRAAEALMDGALPRLPAVTSPARP